MPRRARTATEVLAEDPLDGLETESLEPPLMVEGDAPPDPSSGDDDEGVLEGEVEPKPKRVYRKRVKATTEPRLRASPAAKAGAAALYGYGGVGFTLVGGVVGLPGLQAAGFVMQAQAEDAGKIIAKKALGTKWYPYLERAAQGGEMAPVIAGPVLAAIFIQIPPLRGALAPVLDIMLGDLDMPSAGDGSPTMKVTDFLAEYVRNQEEELERQRHRSGVPPGAAVYQEAPVNGDVPPPPVDESVVREAPRFNAPPDVPPIIQTWPEEPQFRDG